MKRKLTVFPVVPFRCETLTVKRYQLLHIYQHFKIDNLYR
jgi:hypothetical protein